MRDPAKKWSISMLKPWGRQRRCKLVTRTCLYSKKKHKIPRIREKTGNQEFFSIMFAKNSKQIILIYFFNKKHTLPLGHWSFELQIEKKKFYFRLCLFTI